MKSANMWENEFVENNSQNTLQVENENLCVLTSNAVRAPPLNSVLPCFCARARHGANILPHLVQGSGFFLFLSNAIHYKVFPKFKRTFIILVCEKIPLP